MRQEIIKFDKGIDKKINLDYLLYMPENYEQKSKWPLILFLHGAGEVGDNVERVRDQGLPKKLETTDAFPFVVVAPQCPKNTNWGKLHDTLYEIVTNIKKQYNIDEKKVYLTGLSMGGYGTWSLAVTYPDEFAALVPICGGIRDKNEVKKLKDIPIWTFHGTKDKVIPIEVSQGLVDVLTSCGGNIKFTQYPELGHDSWTKTYNNPALYDWLLSQEKKNL